VAFDAALVTDTLVYLASVWLIVAALDAALWD
jgi:hypothetical protein